MLLDINGVDAGYSGKQIVRGASLSVGKGEVVALVGHNGAGKTTLLDGLFGLRRIDKGSVHFDGAAVTNRSPAANLKAGIAYAPQGARVYRKLTVADNLKVGGFVCPAAQRSKAIAQVYETFPILHARRDGRAGLLSGGERAMLAMGMVLAASPRLIFLDEPSGGLAPILVERAFETIRRIATEMSMAVLIVEQNLSETFAIADRAYVMAGGRIVAHGTPAELVEGAGLSKLFFGELEEESR